MIFNLTSEEKLELKSIMSLLKSKDEESQQLGFSMMKTSDTLLDNRLSLYSIECSREYFYPEEHMTYAKFVSKLKTGEMSNQLNGLTIYDFIQNPSYSGYYNRVQMAEIIIRILLTNKNFIAYIEGSGECSRKRFIRVKNIVDDTIEDLSGLESQLNKLVTNYNKKMASIEKVLKVADVKYDFKDITIKTINVIK